AVLRDAVGERRAAVGVIYVGARLDERGELHATGAGRAELGRPSGTEHAKRIDELVALLRDGGITVDVVDHPCLAVWRKLARTARIAHAAASHANAVPIPAASAIAPKIGAAMPPTG